MGEPRIRFRGYTGVWERRKLGEVFEEYVEKNHPELPALTIIQGGGTVRRDESDRNILYDKASLAGYKLVQKDDFILHLRSFEGGLERATCDGIISPAYHTFHGVDADSRFYYLFFRSFEFIKKKLVPHIYGIRDGKRIDIEGMKSIKIPYPTYEEQKKIGDYIDHLDHLITLYQRKCEETKILKKYMLQNMFPQNDSNVPKIRFDGFTNVWKQRKFSEIANRESSKGVSALENPCVEYEDVVAEEGRLNKDVRMKGVQKTGIVFNGTQVLYGKLRPYLHNWLNPDFSGVAVGDWWVLKPIETDKSFLYRLIQTSRFDNIANQSSGSKMPRADWNLISNTEFMIPESLEEQSKIGRFFTRLDHLITLYQRKYDKLQNIKKFMLQNMFI